MIHRFIDTFGGCPNLGFAVIGPGGGGTNNAVWLAETGQSWVEIVNSRVGGVGALGDPTVAPDNCLTLYSVVPNNTTFNLVTTVPTNDSGADTDIASSDNNTVATVSFLSLQPSWHPSGQYVIFRGIQGAPSNGGPPTIERVDYDGANPVTLKSGPFASGAGSTRPYERPVYSDDGTKILTYQDRGNILDIFTCDADGTNDVLVARTVDTNTSKPIWLAGTTTVVYTTSTGTTAAPLTGSQTVRKVEADGTGDTLLYTDPNAQNVVSLWSTTPFASLPDGSGVLYARYFPGDPANEQWRVGVIDAAGGGWTDLGHHSAGFQFNVNIPVVRGGRIWWDDGMFGAGGDGIVSTALDGTDYTVEDNTNVFSTLWWGL